MEYNSKESVVIVPGLGGSVLETRKDSKRIWPSPNAALPFKRGQWKRSIQTTISKNGKKISSSVPIRPRNFGGLKGVSTLYDINWKILDIRIVDYFRKLITHLGDFEIHGAPYDFRLVPDPETLDNYFKNLKKLIEHCLNPATIIAHSLGAVIATVFLVRQSPEWKAQYIKQFISVSGPYGGATKAIHACLSGDTETPISISREFYRQIEIGFGGVLWMINSPEVFTDTDVLYGTQIEEALNKVSPASALAYKNLIRPLHKETLIYPGVKTYLIYGTGISTMLKLKYSHPNFSDSPKIEKADGDGTVPLRSLQAVSHRWPVAGEYPIFKANHLHILNHPSFLEVIDQIFS